MLNQSLPSLAAALHCPNAACPIYLSGLNKATMKNMRYDALVKSIYIIGGGEDKWKALLQALAIDWGEKSIWPEVCKDDTGSIDFVIVSALIYQASIVPLLKYVIELVCFVKLYQSYFFLCIVPMR